MKESAVKETVMGLKASGKPVGETKHLIKEGGKVVGTETVKTIVPASDSNVLAKQEIEFKRLAAEVIRLTVETGEKYLSLCTFIRTEQISKKNATAWLLDMGFSKPRASEVCRVAMSDEKTWTAFAAKQLGWRGVLKLTRGNLEEMKKVNDSIVPPEFVKEVTAELVQEEESAQSKSDEKYKGMTDEQRKKAEEKEFAEAARGKCDKAATVILLRANHYAKLPKKWSIANGYCVVLQRDPAQRGPKLVNPDAPKPGEVKK